VWVKTGLAADQHPGEVLPARAMAVPEFYDIDAVWPAESLKRRRLMRANAQKAVTRLGAFLLQCMSLLLALSGHPAMSEHVRSSEAN
jgi:hypothetical protein